MDGQERCRMHGGASPQAIAAAGRRRDDEVARQAAARWSLPREVSPGDALLEEVHRSAGMVAWVEAQIVRVTGESPDNLVRGVRSTKRRDSDEGWATTTEAGPQVHAWLKLWQVERSHLVEVCKVSLQAGVEQRRVELAEQEGERAGRWLQACLAPLGLDEAQMQLVLGAARTNLTLLQGGRAS